MPESKSKYQIRKERRRQKEKAINGVHALRLQTIRPYVDFDYDARKPLTDYQKRKIRKYYREVSGLIARPHHVYRPKTKKRLRQAQEFAQHEKHLPELKVAFIPTDGTAKARVRWTKKGPIIVTRNVKIHHIEIDPAKLATDSAKEIRRVLNETPGAKQYGIQAGKFEIAAAASRRNLKARIEKLMSKYANEEENNFYGNWLRGVRAYYFDDQKSMGEFVAARRQRRDKVKRENRARIRRLNRAKKRG